MDSQLADKAAKLETYEKLEQELDDVVMQAAEGKGCSIDHYSSPSCRKAVSFSTTLPHNDISLG